MAWVLLNWIVVPLFPELDAKVADKGNGKPPLVNMGTDEFTSGKATARQCIPLLLLGE